METMVGALIGITFVAAYQLVRITNLLMEMNGRLRDIAFYTQRIPVNPENF